MKTFLLLMLFSASVASAHEKSVATSADKLATGKFSSQGRHPWPFPILSIGNNMQSYQNYGSPYWHDGLDIRANEDQVIYAAAGGKVVNVENYRSGSRLYWEVAILDSKGFVWKYHHVAPESIPEEIKTAYKNGSVIKSGTVLGSVVRWPVTSYGEMFHHLHLLIVGADGKYINPLLMMDPLPDTAAPVIHKIGLAQNHKPVNGNQVSGPHALFVEASDLILHKKYLLPPHKISYKIDQDEEKTLWEFVHLPSGTNDKDYITDFYMPGSCGDYDCRKFYFNLNFTTKEPRAQMNLSPGPHEVQVTVTDAEGNTATEKFNWIVR